MAVMSRCENRSLLYFLDRNKNFCHSKTEAEICLLSGPRKRTSTEDDGCQVKDCSHDLIVIFFKNNCKYFYPNKLVVNVDGHMVQ